MRRIAPFIIAALLLCAAPVFAQYAPPTPTPRPLSPELEVLNEMAQQLQVMSANNTSTTNGAVLLMGAGFFVLTVALLVFAVWIFRGGAQPLVEQMRKANQRADAAEESETHMRTLSDDRERRYTELQKQNSQNIKSASESLERVAKAMLDQESRTEAIQGRSSAVETLKVHTTEDGNLTRADVKKIVDKLEEADKETKRAATREDLQQLVEPIQQGLNELLKRAREAQHQVQTDDDSPAEGSRVILHDARLVPPDDDLDEPPSSSKLPGVPLS